MDAAIIVDIRNMRCSLCKVGMSDKLATECKNCGAKFTWGVTSNHVGLADKLRKERGEALKDDDVSGKYPELVGG